MVDTTQEGGREGKSSEDSNSDTCYLGTEVANIDGTSYLLDLGWVNVAREGRRLGDYSTHHRDEGLGDGSSNSIGCSS